jgi:CRISPR-associated protein Csm1
VLAPNTQEIKRLLASIEQEVSRQLFSTWGTGLSVSLVYTEMGTDQLEGKSVNEVWSNIHEAFSLRKRERLNRLVLERYGDIFEAQENGGETRRDVISQIEISPGEIVFKLEGAIPTPAVQSDYDDPEAKLVSGPTREQIILGFFMKSEMYRATGTSVMSFSFGNDFDESRKIVPAQIGIRHFILNKGEQVRRIGSVSQQILKVNDTNFMSVEASDKAVRGFELYGGNQYPESIYQYRSGDQAPKTFSEMAGAKDEDRAKESSNYNQEFGEVAFKRLGILRMDVDGLGSVFRHFKGSMAHFSALSRQLDWFFKGYLNTLWEEGQIEVKDRSGEKQPFPFREWTQIIYSGGDDLFLVGKWDCLLELAQQIELKFREWVCGHPGLGISGGMVFTTHKFPVIKAARQCDDFEKLAKRHKFTDKAGKIVWQKNSLMVFDHPLHWEHELPIVIRLKNEMLRHIEADILPRGFIIGLQTFHQLKVVQEQSNDTSTWRWQLAYQIARLQNRLHKRTGKDDSGEQVNELFVFLKELKTNIFADRYEGESLASKTNYHFFDLLSIAARWSEYELRTILDKKSTNNTLSI